jgi:hypothetical protein
VWLAAERPRLVLVDEGIFYADDLAERDPVGLAVLRDYAESQPRHAIGLDADDPLAWPRIRFMSRTEFVRAVLFAKGYRR